MSIGHLHDKKIIYRDLKPENIGLVFDNLNFDDDRELSFYLEKFDFWRQAKIGNFSLKL